MREIKFRAWDNVDRRIVAVHGISFDEAIITLTDKDGDYAERLLIEVELMQYTGLKDKNGVEIYEGDIVTKWHEDPDDDKGLTIAYEVIWYQREAEFRLERPALIDGFNYDGSDVLEVIGNIYENPELVKGRL